MTLLEWLFPLWSARRKLKKAMLAEGRRSAIEWPNVLGQVLETEGFFVLEYPGGCIARVWRNKRLKLWVAECTALGLLTQGTTKQEAREAIQSAARMYVDECDRRRLDWKKITH